MDFDLNSKSILKIVGDYQINNTSNGGITHDKKDDVLTIVYDGYFNQATIGELDPKSGDGNPFSVLTEVDDFESLDLTAVLRTKINGNNVVMEISTPIRPPDDFLSKINNEVFIFEYDGSEINTGCTQPQYPNYHCSNRFDGSDYTDDDLEGDECKKDEIGCTDPTACSCDKLRCIGLCGVCDDGFSTNQYECTGVWTEYCGTENQWKCGSFNEGFGFYNPSNYILNQIEGCTYEPIKPQISIGVYDEITNTTLPSLNGVTDLQFEDNDDFVSIVENNRIMIKIIRNNTDIGQYYNDFNTVSFDIHKVRVKSIEVTGAAVGSFELNGSISTINISTADFSDFDIDIKVEIEDIISWKVTLQNIIFTNVDEIIEHEYDNSYIETNKVDNINPIDLETEYDFREKKRLKLDKLYNREYTQPMELHRGDNNVSIWVSADRYDGLTNTVRDGFELFEILEDPETGQIYDFIQRISNQGGTVKRIGTTGSVSDWEFIEGSESSFSADGDDAVVRTGPYVAYTFSICVEDSLPDSCYKDNDPSSGILQDEFKIQFKGYIDLPPTRIDYDFICPDDNQHYVWDNETNCNNNCNEPCQQNLNYPRLVTTGTTQSGQAVGAYIATILDTSTNFLNVGFHPQVKEFIYEDVNTILSFEDNIPTLGNVTEDLPTQHDNLGVARTHGLQGKYIDIIQYETELITHVDMDFDCDYSLTDLASVTPGSIGNITDSDKQNELRFGECYDTYLGTLTNLSLGEGYAINLNTIQWTQGDLNGLDSVNDTLFATINLYYDFCNIASGGSALHEPNSDTDDNAFCIPINGEAGQCYGGITHSQTCFTDGTIDDICFGNCCLYPNEIVDFYEADEGESVGNMNNNRLRLCDDVEDGYTTYRCRLDDKEYPIQSQSPENGFSPGCEQNCGDNPEDCIEIKYYKEANDCDGFLDCFDNCHEEITGEFAEFDRYGICCRVGEMDAEGICFGNSSTADCGFDFALTSDLDITFDNFNQNLITFIDYSQGLDPSETGYVIINSGTFDVSLDTNESQVSELIIPLTPTLNVKNAYFNNLDESNIIITNNPGTLSFEKLFNISITTNNNSILLTSLNDGVFFSTTSNTPISITVEWEADLPNSSEEYDVSIEYGELCVLRDEINAFRLDQGYSFDFNFEDGFEDNGCFNNVVIYGCDDITAINSNFYCNIVECFGDIDNDGNYDLCEYIGCDNLVYNKRGALGAEELDACGICAGGNKLCTGPGGDDADDGVNPLCPATGWDDFVIGPDAGCDGVCFSGLVLDDCGVCNGNNGTMDCHGHCPDTPFAIYDGGCGAENNPGGGIGSLGEPNVCGRDECGYCKGVTQDGYEYGLIEPSGTQTKEFLCAVALSAFGSYECCGCIDETACNTDSTATIQGIATTYDACIYPKPFYLDADGDGLGCPNEQPPLFCDDDVALNLENQFGLPLYVSNANGLENADSCLCPHIIDKCGVCNGNNACEGCLDNTAMNYLLNDYVSPNDNYFDCNGVQITADSDGVFNPTNTDCCIYENDIITDWLMGQSFGQLIDNYGDINYVLFQYIDDNYDYISLYDFLSTNVGENPISLGNFDCGDITNGNECYYQFEHNGVCHWGGSTCDNPNNEMPLCTDLTPFQCTYVQENFNSCLEGCDERIENFSLFEYQENNSGEAFIYVSPDELGAQVDYPNYDVVTNYSYLSGQPEIGNVFITNFTTNTLTFESLNTQTSENYIGNYYSTNFVLGDEFIFKNDNGYNERVTFNEISFFNLQFWSLNREETQENLTIGEQIQTYDIPSGKSFEFKPAFREDGNYGTFNFQPS